MSDATLYFVAALILTVLFGLLYLWHRLRQRLQARRQVFASPVGTTTPFQEEWQNRFQMTMAGARHMEREGYSVQVILQRLSEAERLRAQHDYVDARHTLDSARHALQRLREDGRALPKASGRPLPTTEKEWMEEKTTVTLPSHQVEAHFELSLLSTELEDRKATMSAEWWWKEADQRRGAAQMAYDQGEFQEAWQSALKGRRLLGGKVEGISLSPTVSPTASRSTFSSSSTEQSKENASETAPVCPRCGAENMPEDRFCRSCRAVLRERRCPSCGAPSRPQDKFCGACGSTFS